MTLLKHLDCVNLPKWTIYHHRLKTSWLCPTAPSKDRKSHRLPGVSRMTDMVMSEHTTKITSRAMAIPFQFLCGGLLLPSSYRDKKGVSWLYLLPRNTFIKERFGKGMIIVWKLIKTSFLFKHFFNYSVDIFGVFGNVAELYSCYRGVESAPKHWLWAKVSTKVLGTTRSIRICNHYNRKCHKELKAHLFWKHYQLLF